MLLFTEQCSTRCNLLNPLLLLLLLRIIYRGQNSANDLVLLQPFVASSDGLDVVSKDETQE